MTVPGYLRSSPLVDLLARRRVRGLVQIVLDACCWLAAIVAAQVLRYEFDLGQVNWWAPIPLAAFAIVLQVGFGWSMRLYRGRYTYGSFDEVRTLAVAAGLAGLVTGLLVIAFAYLVPIPRSVMLIALPVAVALMVTVRYLLRLFGEAMMRPNAEERAIIFGAGYMGSVMARRMLTDAASPYLPVALLDDDPNKRHVRVNGVDVLGTLDDLGTVATSTGASVLVVAISDADAALLQRVDAAATQAGLIVKVVPPLHQVLDGVSLATDLRDISIEDIVGRSTVDTNIEAIAGYLTGKRVLVTGAGGSIGMELCRQLNRFDPAELIMLDRDETGLQAAQLAVSGHGLLDSRDVVLADIRDAAAIARIFTERVPEVVFHAAALKHLPMLQQYPEEAWKTNVLGTRNVLEAARHAGVRTFVNISTDKAANPTSVLGHSKRLAERLTAQVGKDTGLNYLSVRFGNVLGSRGSMLPLFTTMIQNGGPLTITHPDVTRFFMTIPEACQLVIQAGAIGSAGEVLILDMGEPVRILDVAKRMIEMSGRDIEIVFTGLREGEKLHEVLVGAGEDDRKRVHPKISHAMVPSLRAEELDRRRWQHHWADTTQQEERTHPVLALLGAGHNLSDATRHP